MKKNGYERWMLIIAVLTLFVGVYHEVTEPPKHGDLYDLPLSSPKTLTKEAHSEVLGARDGIASHESQRAVLAGAIDVTASRVSSTTDFDRPTIVASALDTAPEIPRNGMTFSLDPAATEVVSGRPLNVRPDL